MDKQDKRHGIDPELQIKYTPESEKLMVEMYLEDKGLITITKAIGGILKREQGDGGKEGRAVETRVYKLWRRYNGQDPLFKKLKKRHNEVWTRREVKLLEVAVKYKRKAKDIAILSGRTPKEIQEKIDILTGKTSRKGLF